ncbi:alpha/beta hydrolase family protein [Streptomyces inhibens]|uniref:alpha/beta hydrolase family protein n=1 Tax=Streptomyces inhibens TaxID=2293571 RepID=UPI001EE6F34A|nr:alpha/beta hydrolase [Streptomyces inhibens]UKY49948.1 alpha/beta hydrolase [Streptomyces inhibens]
MSAASILTGAPDGHRRRRASRSLAAGAAVLLAALTTAPALAAPSAVAARTADEGPTTATTVGETAHAAQAADTAPRTDHGRGTLLSITPLGRQNRAEIIAQAQKVGMEAGTARHGVAAYRLTYRTITPDGRPTTASGLLALPTGTSHRPLPPVVHTHGTLAYRGYAPSVGEGPDRAVSVLYASAGRAAIAPDYLGLGTNPGRHPYMDARSAASASLDMLRAAHSAAPKLGAVLDRTVSLTGFSQGGQVAMELGRELDRGADPRFRLGMLAPVGGPYDLDGSELPGMFDGRINPQSAVFYISFFLTAQNRLHPLYKDPSEVFRAPYADRVEDLFDSDHPAEEIAGKLPSRLEDLLTDAWYAKLQHPSGALLESLRANDRSCDWKPDRGVRITLYSASGDRDVPIANTRSCAKELTDHGAKATVVDQGADADHNTSFLRSEPSIARALPVAR